MKISLKWISDFVDVSEFSSKPEELSVLLTNAGLEVDGIENASQQYEKVVVGQVMDLVKHPDADRLTLCQVSLGGGVVQQIICGAKNHKQGDKVVVATPGAILPGNFEIKKSKIRGVESSGMLCSETELGLSDEAEGIIILPADAPVGSPYAEYAGLDDIYFEISVTPNRADCNSHFGIAREIACLTGKPFEFPMKTFDEVSESTKDKIKLVVKDSERCPRYAGRYISGVKIGPSPSWLKKRLEALDMNSINNVVDVTNYIMLELGQPLHAFDAEKVHGAKITVEGATKSEKFVTFDGTEILLTGEELTIRDGKKAVALAGVIGGLNSGVTEETTNLFIEAAYFLQETVRRTSRKLGIQTDSAYRFSRGVDPDSVLLAMNKACQMIQELAGGEIFSDAYDVYPNPVKRLPVNVSLDFVSQQLAMEATEESFLGWMDRLGCQTTVKSSGNYVITPPAYRWDLELEVDFVEEYGRLEGYSNIPEIVPETKIEPTPHELAYTLENKIHNLIQAEGFQQVINYSFVKSTTQDEYLGDVSKLTGLGLPTSKKAVRIKNPLSEDVDVMRTSLTSTLLKNLIHNYRHGIAVGRLYEVGFVFESSKEHFGQEQRLGILAWGAGTSLWNKSEFPLVYELKSNVEGVLKGMGANSWQWRNVEMDKVPDFVHPGQCAELFYEGKAIGYLGSLHPRHMDKLKLRCDTVIGEFCLEKLFKGQPRTPKFKPLPKFPSVERDLAFVMPNRLTSGEVVDEIRRSGGKLIREIEAFDVFAGGTLPDGHKSVAFRMRFQNPDATLSDDQVLELQNKIIDSVSQKFSVSVR